MGWAQIQRKLKGRKAGKVFHWKFVRNEVSTPTPTIWISICSLPMKLTKKKLELQVSK
ncbi:hypothetical protein HanIR_Chr07g0333021 [Helianthus annuus]|nr:hypothetical protein HanIR_Chr07g0333021 [Helianthus annuus]